jgi:hypothetical protein
MSLPAKAHSSGLVSPHFFWTAALFRRFCFDMASPPVIHLLAIFSDWFSYQKPRTKAAE